MCRFHLDIKYHQLTFSWSTNKSTQWTTNESTDGTTKQPALDNAYSAALRTANHTAYNADRAAHRTT